MGKRWTDLSRVPVEALPKNFKRDGSYRPGGYHCWTCGYTTTKKGFAGRQALRAHLKVHVQARRAWQRPLVRHGIAVMAAITLALAGRFGLMEAPAGWVRPWEIDPGLFWVGIGIGLLVMGTALLASVQPHTAMTPGLVRWMQAGVAVGSLSLASVVGLALGVLQNPVPAWTEGLLWAFGALSVWLAVSHGQARYALKRRRGRSSDYTELYEATSPMAARAFNNWLIERARKRRQSRAKKKQRILRQ